MNLPKDLISAQVAKLVARIAAESPENVEADLINRLNADFPGDVGIFVAYFHCKLLIRRATQEQA